MLCVPCFTVLEGKYDYGIDWLVLCKRSITYQDVCLWDGHQPYDTFIHFQITKMHLLLYSHSISGAQPTACNMCLFIYIALHYQL